MMAADRSNTLLTARDFQSTQINDWCAGCGDHGILRGLEKALALLGCSPDEVAVFGGIGCSGKTPYYLNSYGVHTLHGRLVPYAMGAKLANPDLTVIAVGGDGDGLSIGAGHFVNAGRRNLDMTYILFNNGVYGLTKGQYSPTTPPGIRTLSSPDGSIENPVNPVGVAIGSEAGFIARTVDVFQKHMAGVLRRAAGHRGASLVEIAQNCIIFNDGAWSHLTDPDKRLENVLYLEHGQPMRFGRQGEKGIRLNGLRPEVVDVAEVGEENLLVHDEQAAEPTLAYLLSRMGPPDFPTPVGVFRAVDKPVYSGQLLAQVHEAQARAAPDIDALYRKGETWEVD